VDFTKPDEVSMAIGAYWEIQRGDGEAGASP
jgi:hypothetical protein